MPLLHEAADVIRLLLNQAELREGPIALVGHSLGGLIVKQVLRAANEQRGKAARGAARCVISAVWRLRHNTGLPHWKMDGPQRIFARWPRDTDRACLK